MNLVQVIKQMTDFVLLIIKEYMCIFSCISFAHFFRFRPFYLSDHLKCTLLSGNLLTPPLLLYNRRLCTGRKSGIGEETRQFWRGDPGILVSSKVHNVSSPYLFFATCLYVDGCLYVEGFRTCSSAKKDPLYAK